MNHPETAINREFAAITATPIRIPANIHPHWVLAAMTIFTSSRIAGPSCRRQCFNPAVDETDNPVSKTCRFFTMAYDQNRAPGSKAFQGFADEELALPVESCSRLIEYYQVGTAEKDPRNCQTAKLPPGKTCPAISKLAVKTGRQFFNERECRSGIKGFTNRQIVNSSQTDGKIIPYAAAEEKW